MLLKVMKGGLRGSLPPWVILGGGWAAAVPESTTQLLIGHKRPSLTYGHYSQGERLQKDLREYIHSLRYSNEVMGLIRGGMERKRSAETRQRSRHL